MNPKQQLESADLEKRSKDLDLRERLIEDKERLLDTTAKTEKERKKWNELTPASQAGVLCNDPEFLEFMRAQTTEEAIQTLYGRCQVTSRAELSTNSRASREWASMVNDFRIWQQARP